MQSVLITGSNKSNRQKEIEKRLDKLSVSKLDRLWVHAENSVRIDQVRELIRFLHKKPVQGTLRAGILPEAEKATVEAQNALLKILEEPPEPARLFLSAPNEKHLLQTITSRCRIIRLAQTRKLDKKTEQEIKRVFDTLKSVPQDRVGERFELAEEFSSSRESADSFLQNALVYIQKQYLRQCRTFYEAKPSPLTQWANTARHLLLARRLLSANVNPRQVLENLFLTL